MCSMCGVVEKRRLGAHGKRTRSRYRQALGKG